MKSDELIGVCVMVEILMGFEAVGNKLSDAWEANVNGDNPEFSNAYFIKLPMTLGGTTYSEPAEAINALVKAINETRNNIVFEGGSPVSTSGDVAYQLFEHDSVEYIRLGFRDSDTKLRFWNTTRDALDGVVAYSAGGPSVLGTPEIKF